MDNPAFKVYINDQLASTGAIDAEFGVLTTMVTWVRRSFDHTESLTLDMSGLNSVDRKRLIWLKKDVKIGDTITIRIVDLENQNTEALRTLELISKEEDLQNKLNMYHILKEELKEHL